MEVTYHGLSCVRLRGRQTQVVVDPPESARASVAKLAPDIIVRTEGATDPELLRGHDNQPQEVCGPGEFEVGGVAIHALPSGDRTIMLIEVDDVRVVTLGVLARQLTEDEIDALGHVDVLLVPVGGGDALDAAAACKLTRAIEPAVVVPVRYRSEAEDDSGFQSLDGFAKEMGLQGDVVPQPKLTLTGAMPNAEDTRIVVLEMRAV